MLLANTRNVACNTPSITIPIRVSMRNVMNLMNVFF